MTRSIRSRQPLEVVYRLLRRGLEGCSRAVNVVSTHQSSYPTPLIKRSETNPSGFTSVYAKRTIGFDIVFNAPMALVGDEAQVEARFSPFEHSANLDAR